MCIRFVCNRNINNIFISRSLVHNRYKPWIQSNGYFLYIELWKWIASPSVIYVSYDQVTPEVIETEKQIEMGKDDLINKSQEMIVLCVCMILVLSDDLSYFLLGCNCHKIVLWFLLLYYDCPTMCLCFIMTVLLCSYDCPIAFLRY